MTKGQFCLSFVYKVLEENYEVMSDGQPEYSEADEEPSVQTTLQSSEKNVEPVTENYAEPEQEPEDYEVVSTGETKETLPTGMRHYMITPQVESKWDQEGGVRKADTSIQNLEIVGSSRLKT